MRHWQARRDRSGRSRLGDRPCQIEIVLPSRMPQRWRQEARKLAIALRRTRCLGRRAGLRARNRLRRCHPSGPCRAGHVGGVPSIDRRMTAGGWPGRRSASVADLTGRAGSFEIVGDKRVDRERSTSISSRLMESEVSVTFTDGGRLSRKTSAVPFAAPSTD